MESQVEKMYRNAEIGKEMMCFFECSRKTCSVDCEHFEKLDMSYPPFTVEKQLELIKWLGKNKDGFGLFNDGTEGLSCRCDFHREWFRKDFYAEDFDNALAGLVNDLWQDLTEQEKEQIKEILE